MEYPAALALAISLLGRDGGLPNIFDDNASGEQHNSVTPRPLFRVGSSFRVAKRCILSIRVRSLVHSQTEKKNVFTVFSVVTRWLVSLLSNRELTWSLLPFLGSINLLSFTGTVSQRTPPGQGALLRHNSRPLHGKRTRPFFGWTSSNLQ